MFAKAIVRPPAQNFAEGLTTAGLGAPNYKRALEQHEAYCAALERCGLTLIRLDADPNYPDSCFVEDTAIVIPEFAYQCARVPSPTRVVLARPGAVSRIGEVKSMRAALEQTAPEFAIKEIQPPGTLDGGDICEAGAHYFIGLSERTNETGAEQLAQFVIEHGYTSNFVDIRGSDSLLHLKSGLAYLGDNRLVVTEALAGLKEFDDYGVVPVPSGAEYAANCVRVNDYVLVAAGYEQFERNLRKVGYQTLALDMTEFQKMDGGLSCLSLRW
jgi:dimethylargininase